MKCGILIIFVAALTLSFTATHAVADVVSDFNDGTMQGWSVIGYNKGISNPGTGGNPGGFVKAIDRVGSSDNLWAVAPSKYLGNWHNKAKVSADLIQLSFSGSQSSGVVFQLSGPGGVYTCVFKNRPATAWSTFQADLNPALWKCKSGTWDALLDNVTDFRILMEYISGDETNGIDNVRVTDAATTLTISQAKQVADGTKVTVTGVVSRGFTGFAYIQSTDGAAGIKVNASGLTEGNLVTVTGTLSTSCLERVLSNVVILSSVSASSPNPIDINVEDIGGIGDTTADPTLGSSSTPKETGLLINTSGKVTKTNTDGTFVITDNGTSITTICPPAMAVPVLGSIVQITGISSASNDSSPVPVVRLAHEEFAYLSLPLNSNIIRNPGAEEGPSGLAGEKVNPLPGWIPVSSFTIVKYGYIYPTSESQLIKGGVSFFFGGINTARSGATQDIDVSCLSAAIDAGKLTAKLGGNMGGRDTERDYGTITATFFDKDGNALGSLQLGPQAASSGHLKRWEKSIDLPVLTRRIQVAMAGVRLNGNNNDQFYDNLSLVLNLKKVTLTTATNFDDGTLQGWLPVGDTAGVSNPGSFIQMLDVTKGVACWMVAPDSFLGDWHGVSAVSADLIEFYGGALWSPAKFQISGPGGSYTHVFKTRPTSVWSTFTAPLVESEWTRTSGSWDALLSEVSDFRILLEFASGDESNGLDNVRLINGG